MQLHMRKKEREITEITEIEAIISEADVCHIAFADNNIPYIVSMNFGYCGGNQKRLFFHCAPEGRKLEMMKRNNYVCFEMDTAHSIVAGKEACDYTMKYASVVGYGYLNVINESNEKIEGLNHIMKHYAGSGEYSFSPTSLIKTLVLCLTITEITAKKC